MKYDFISDASHGWLKAPVSLVKELGIADKITLYSYISEDGKTAYLEEDSDGCKFAKAIEARGEKFEYEEKYCDGRSYVRSLPPFTLERCR